MQIEEPSLSLCGSVPKRSNRAWTKGAGWNAARRFANGITKAP
ncbi:hypothetical protein [Sutterella wadsworthensis]